MTPNEVNTAEGGSIHSEGLLCRARLVAGVSLTRETEEAS